ncbi:transcriptional regulator [Mycobacterium sp. 1164966.3]|uniref:PAS and ANTAR domain-containing protein n=1 Tax=Mycobacterium sp. 1164966.3 TaxID=1856861 RepID=UPI000800E79A|nr:PAS and ANTAR domain-containing protein [Mycobacterium sp. 1164966.3]OBA80180.1 transcriptional regulator [Mycobacterium sp. 1164966.3]
MRDEPQLRPQQWSRVGAFRYVVRDDRWEWSDEVAHLHGYEPGTVAPTTELVLAHKHPDDRATVADLIEQVRRHGIPFSSRHRLIDTRGVEHVVIVVGDPWYDDDGPAGISGFYVDITEQLNTDVQDRLTEAVAAINARQSVINQAIGMLMLRYGINADAAFELLSKLSQDSNIKLRTIAERVVASPGARDAMLQYVDGIRPKTVAQRVRQRFNA